MAKSKKIKVNGEEFRSVSAAAKKFGLDRTLVNMRLRCGWTIEEAFEIKNRDNKVSRAITIHNREFKSIRSAAKYFNISPTTLHDRLKRNLTPEEAVNISVVRNSSNSRLGQNELDRLSKKELTEDMRICTSCKKKKSLNKFWKNEKEKRIKRHIQCADCMNEKREKRKYGVSRQELIRKDGNMCVCGKNFNENIKAPHIDHNHDTGKVRGLLCNNCNTGLGLLQDDTIVLMSLVKYLIENDDVSSKKKEEIKMMFSKIKDLL